MVIEYLMGLTIEEILDLEESIHHKNCKWDYESYEGFDEFIEEYENRINIRWVEDGKIKYDTIYDEENESILRVGNYVILLDSLCEVVHVFDDNMLCDGVIDGFFTFDSFVRTRYGLNRVGKNIFNLNK